MLQRIFKKLSRLQNLKCPNFSNLLRSFKSLLVAVATIGLKNVFMAIKTSNNSAGSSSRVAMLESDDEKHRRLARMTKSVLTRWLRLPGSVKILQERLRSYSIFWNYISGKLKRSRSTWTYRKGCMHWMWGIRRDNGKATAINLNARWNSWKYWALVFIQGEQTKTANCNTGKSE